MTVRASSNSSWSANSTQLLCNIQHSHRREAVLQDGCALQSSSGVQLARIKMCQFTGHAEIASQAIRVRIMCVASDAVCWSYGSVHAMAVPELVCNNARLLHKVRVAKCGGVQAQNMRCATMSLRNCSHLSPTKYKQTSCTTYAPASKSGGLGSLRAQLAQGRHCPSFAGCLHGCKPIAQTLRKQSNHSQLQHRQASSGQCSRSSYRAALAEVMQLPQIHRGCTATHLVHARRTWQAQKRRRQQSAALCEAHKCSTLPGLTASCHSSWVQLLCILRFKCALCAWQHWVCDVLAQHVASC